MHDLIVPDVGEPQYCARCAHPLQRRPDGGRARPYCPECGWTYYAKPALGAAAIVEENGRIVLVQRAHEPYQGWWTLPTGFVEYGEDAAETAAREVLEETGLLVEIDGYHGIFFGGGDPRGVAHVAVFYAHRLGGSLAPGDDAADTGWFSPEEIPEEIAFEGHRKAIARWLTRHREGTAEPSLLLYAGTGPAPPLLVYAVIENPKGTADRIVYDSARGHFVPSGEIFPDPLPCHYGWIPRTISAGDDRELDVVVVGEGDTAVGSVVPVRPIGTLLRADADHKVLAIRADLPSAYATVTDAADRPELREMVERLFRPRAVLKGWASAPETRRLIMETQHRWVERHRDGEPNADHRKASRERRRADRGM
jgi:ADP-ribose pyrophosphatase YjhB (NUDIX family)/inorganic pyrophosphatase